jgi:hypothetical protein
MPELFLSECDLDQFFSGWLLVPFGMQNTQFQDDLLPVNGHCHMCGRYFNLNEVHVGVFTDYFLLRTSDCPCPTCFGHQLHRIEDPMLEDVLDAKKFCDIKPTKIIAKASVWEPCRFDLPLTENPD